MPSSAWTASRVATPTQPVAESGPVTGPPPQAAAEPSAAQVAAEPIVTQPIVTEPIATQPSVAPVVHQPTRVLRAAVVDPAAAERAVAERVPSPADTAEVQTSTAAHSTAAHSTTAPRARRSPRVAVRLGVLGLLAGITVIVPVSQGILPTPAAYGSDALADSTLPSTVSALAGSQLSELPPASLVSTASTAVTRGLDTASRDDLRSPLAGCDGAVRDAGQNGMLKQVDLCTLWDNHTQLRADAAVSFAEFDQAFAARFGADLCLASGYRTLAEQRAVKAEKGGLAAAPGKSNHGWGLAVDLCGDQTSGVKWAWIQENGPSFGWQNPAWARPGGVGPFEKWHWEYAKGVQAADATATN